jgi:hypothetical protein
MNVPFPFVIFHIQLVKGLIALPASDVYLQPKFGFREDIRLMRSVRLWRKSEDELEID